MSIFASCSPVNRSIIGCKDIFGLVCWTSVYCILQIFRESKPWKLHENCLLQLSWKSYAWVWVWGLFWFPEDFNCFHQLLDFCNVSSVHKSRNLKLFEGNVTVWEVPFTWFENILQCNIFSDVRKRTQFPT